MDPRSKSRHITEGPDRAPARAMLKAIGFTDEDLREADRRHRQHLDRDDAVQLQPARARREREGGHPRRRRHADGVQHHRDQRRHHHGHRGHEGLAGQPRGDRRLDRAGRAAGTCSTPSSRSSAATRRSRARRWRCCGSNIPALVLYGGSIAPGRFEGRDLTIVDVFEAVGAHAAGKIVDADAAGASRTSPVPGAGACGGQFTANTMAMAMEFLGLSPVGSASFPPTDPRKDDAGPRAGRLIDGPAASATCGRASIVTRAVVRERDRAAWRPPAARPTRCCTCWRMAREAEVPLTIDDFDRDQRAHAAHRRPAARRAVTSRSTWTRPAACRWSRSGWSRRS